MADIDSHIASHQPPHQNPLTFSSVCPPALINQINDLRVSEVSQCWSGAARAGCRAGVFRGIVIVQPCSQSVCMEKGRHGLGERTETTRQGMGQDRREGPF